MATSRHPGDSHLQLGGDKDAVVATPASSLLRHAVFQHRHACSVQPAHHRLNHASPQIEALQSWGGIERLQQGDAIDPTGFRLRKTRGRHSDLPQRHGKLHQPNVHVPLGLHDHLGMEPHQRDRQRVNAMGARHAKRPSRIGGRGEATRPSHDQNAWQFGLRIGMKHVTFHRRTLSPLASHPRRSGDKKQQEDASMQQDGRQCTMP